MHNAQIQLELTKLIISISDHGKDYEENLALVMRTYKRVAGFIKKLDEPSDQSKNQESWA